MNNITHENAHPATIYALKCPITKRVRYVGQTRQSLESRLQNHIATRASGSGWRRQAWLDELEIAGLRPIIEPLELVVGDARAIAECEAKWILHFRSEGWGLLNGNIPTMKHSNHGVKSGVKVHKKPPPNLPW